LAILMAAVDNLCVLVWYIPNHESTVGVAPGARLAVFKGCWQLSDDADAECGKNGSGGLCA
jgi:hypothetical protein